MQDTRSTHERCWDDIPWWVNGTLSESKQRALAAHVEHCVECRDEVARQRRIHACLRADDDSDAVMTDSWNKLLARIDAAAAEPNPKSQQRETRGHRWMLPVLWAQAAAIAALAAALLWPTPRADYVTLTAPADATTRGAIRIVFAPDASLDQVNRLLRDMQATVVAGPSEAGVYTVNTTTGDVTQTVALLRQHPEVLFAEITGDGAR